MLKFNVILASSAVPEWAVYMIVGASVAMILLGLFLTIDTIALRRREKNKDKAEAAEKETLKASAEEEKKNQKEEKAKEVTPAPVQAEKSSELMPEERLHLEYLERLNKEEDEYISKLERELELKKQIRELDDNPVKEYVVIKEEAPKQEPVKEEPVQEEVPSEEPVKEEPIEEPVQEEAPEEEQVKEEVPEEIPEEKVSEENAPEEVPAEEPVHEEETTVQEVSVTDINAEVNAEAETEDENDASEETNDEETTEVLESVVDEETKETKRTIVLHKKKLEGRLHLASDDVRAQFDLLANKLLSFKGMKERMSSSADSFRNGRDIVAKLAIKGKTLCLYLAVEPSSLEGSKYTIRDVSSVKKHASTPVLFKVRGSRSLRWAEELIDMLAKNKEFVISDKYEKQDFVSKYLPLSEEELKAAGLISDTFYEEILDAEGKRISMTRISPEPASEENAE